MDAPYTLSDLVRLTGLKPRTLQFWTLNGVIECDPDSAHGGPGKPRRYPDHEAAIAIVLAEITRIPLQVGALKEIAQLVRKIIQHGADKGLKDPEAVAEEYFDRVFAYHDEHLQIKTINKINKVALEKTGLKEVEQKIENIKIDYHWSIIETARRGTSKNDMGLLLSVDDVGRWFVDLDEIDTLASLAINTGKQIAVWNIQITLNLTRALAKLRTEGKPV